MCYMRGIDGLGFDNGHNYRRWTLIASPTVFHDDDPRYVYIAIPKSNAADIPAQVVWPSEELDIYGCNEGGTQVGSTDYYYIWTRGWLPTKPLPPEVKAPGGSISLLPTW